MLHEIPDSKKPLVFELAIHGPKTDNFAGLPTEELVRIFRKLAAYYSDEECVPSSSPYTFSFSLKES